MSLWKLSIYLNHKQIFFSWKWKLKFNHCSRLFSQLQYFHSQQSNVIFKMRFIAILMAWIFSICYTSIFIQHLLHLPANCQWLVENYSLLKQFNFWFTNCHKHWRPGRRELATENIGKDKIIARERNSDFLFFNFFYQYKIELRFLDF